ncbi:hypothetical protein [Geomicrobium sediminis]|uniref:Uncharacterized protein n=1 Tax=Geomicrobium sediminis TaxID=1347788 RepID=A0ABS2P8M5_9BACL|nr:hypothetical protein [Geomicrobium sediminis]MBM7631749.1 hypothetical protein [Geomicrobium sediminis]
MALYNVVKDALRFAKDSGNSELYFKMVEVQEKSLDLQHENYELNKEIKKLKEEKDVSKSLKVTGHFYYFHNKVDEGLFCTACWDKDKNLIRVHVSDSYGVDTGKCPICNFGSSYIES